jgi:hypothetical protein
VPDAGLVVKIAVEEGDEVQEGQALATVEAMKMENILKAERKGVVKKIKARRGEPEGRRRDHGVRVMPRRSDRGRFLRRNRVGAFEGSGPEFSKIPAPYRPAGFFSSASVRAMGILSMELTISRPSQGRGLRIIGFQSLSIKTSEKPRGRSFLRKRRDRPGRCR